MPLGTEDDLTGLGMPPQLADLIGSQPITQAGAGTTQGTATSLRTQSVELTTAGGQTAFIVPAIIGINREVLVVNTSATPALIFPPVGGTMNGVLNASFSVAQNKPAVIWQYKRGFWTVFLSA